MKYFVSGHLVAIVCCIHAIFALYAFEDTNLLRSEVISQRANDDFINTIFGQIVCWYT